MDAMVLDGALGDGDLWSISGLLLHHCNCFLNITVFLVIQLH